MRPTTASDDNVFDFQALLYPGTVFEQPKDVVTHPSLTLPEKRAILASWASDASAIASCPALRAPEGLRAPVSIDAILEALCELDGGPRNPPGGKPQRRFSTARTLQPEEDRMNELHLSRQAIELSEPAAAGRQSVSSERGPVAPGRASPPVGFRLLSPSPSFRCGLRKFQGLLTYVEGSRNGTMASL